MAYKLSFGGQTKDKKLDPKPVTFINTFFFQFVNPKSIIVGLTSISLFIDAENNYLRDSIILTTSMVFNGSRESDRLVFNGKIYEKICHK